MDGLKYTKIISQKISKLNEILLPSTSGTIITTGNMRELPSIETHGDLTVGGAAGCSSVVFTGSKLYEDAMGFFNLLTETYHKKPVWKHQQLGRR
jgi:hypothetical protein